MASKTSLEISIVADSKDAERKLKRTGQAAEKFGKDTKGASDKAGKGLRDFGKDAKSSGDRAEKAVRAVASVAGRMGVDVSAAADKASASFKRMSTDAEKSAGDTQKAFGGKFKAGMAGAAVAAGAAFSKAFADSMDIEVANDKLAATLGLSEKRSKSLGKVAGKLYADAYGESLTEVTGAVGSVVSSIDGMRKATDDQVKRATTRALDFASAFEVDVSRAVASVGVLMNSGLARDSTQAFDLITRASQRVPVEMREDILDASDEYAQFFNALGLNGQQAFGALIAGTQKGKIGIDKAGDAVKEFATLATEVNNPAVTEVYNKIGLNADTMANKILKGGDSAKGATKQIVDGLLGIENPAQRAESAVALFGTPLEDLGKDNIPKFLDALRGGSTVMDGFRGSTDKMGDALNDNARTRVEAFKRDLEGKLIVALDAVITTVPEVGAAVGDAFGEARKAVGSGVSFILRRVDDLLGAFSSTFSFAGKLPGVGKKFRGVADDINEARENVRGLADRIDGVNRKRIKLHVDFDEITRAIDAGRSLNEIATDSGLALSQRPRRPGGRKGGRLGASGFRRFQAGGMVPAAVSSGEALRFPNGSWAEVPGQRTAADNVLTSLPSGTEVYTDHGQALLGSGASRSEALRAQMPHFAKGGKVKPGKYTATAYGPPWGGINGTGITKTGVNLKGGPKRYIVAVDPSRIPLGSKVKAWPNPFGHRGAFSAEDTGGAIKGNRLDFYDWRGRKTQRAWGRRQVKVSRPSGTAVISARSRVVLGDRYGESARTAGFEAGLAGASRVRGDLLAEMFAGSIGKREVTGETRGTSSSSRSSGQPGTGRIGKMISWASRVASKGMPYVYGGGHGKLGQPTGGGYDCSGYVSGILGAGGLINRPMTTDGFKRYGRSGTGDLMSIGVRGSTGRQAHMMIGLRPNPRSRFQFFESGSGRGPSRRDGWSGGFPIKRHTPGFRGGGIVNKRGDLQPDPRIVGWGLRTGGKVPALASLVRGATRPAATDAGGVTRAFDALSKRLADTMRVSWGSLARLVASSVRSAAQARKQGDATTARRFDSIANVARGQQGIRLAKPITAFQAAGERFDRDSTILGLQQRIAGTEGQAGIAQSMALGQGMLGTLAKRRVSLERGLERARKTGNPEIVKQLEDALSDLEVQSLEVQASLADLGRESEAAAVAQAEAAEAAREAAEAARAASFAQMEAQASAQTQYAQLTSGLGDDVQALQHALAVSNNSVHEAIRVYGLGSAEATSALVAHAQTNIQLNETMRQLAYEGVRSQMSAADTALIRAQVDTAGDTSDDLAALNESLQGATQGYQQAIAAGDAQGVQEFGQAILGIKGSIDGLKQSVEENTSAMADLYKQQAEESRRREKLSQTQYGVLANAIAEVANGGIGGKLGLGLQSVGFAGGGVRYAPSIY